ncbi:MAG: hypothetical protein FWF96_02160, partial [Kiritimatiellaeota bacterium]|nr:hypothetical protein [Kiritimatiellota bacterium]
MPASLKLSERSQVVTILVVAVLALVLAWVFLLWPQFSKSRENRQTREQLANSPFAKLSIETLNDAAGIEKKSAAALDQDWDATAQRLATLSGFTPKDRIAFQVAYAFAQNSLQTKAKTLNIKLPATLADPNVTSTDSIRERFLQLKTVEKLVDLVITEYIIGITSIRTLPTIVHYGADQKLICEEYPVEVEFTTPFDSLFYLFSSIFEEERIFVFSKIRVT